MRVIVVNEKEDGVHNDLGNTIERLYNASREDNKQGFILRHMLVLPHPYPQVAIFSYVWKWGCVRGSKYYGITKNDSSVNSRKRVYLRKKKMLDVYMKYISYYYDNRIAVDDFIANVFSKKNQIIFKEIMTNPFISTPVLASKLKMKSSTIRVIYGRCRKAIMKCEWADVMRTLLMDMDKIVFGRYKVENK